LFQHTATIADGEVSFSGGDLNENFWQ
jgi:hypothetical protein